MASSADSSVVPCKKRVRGDLLLLSDVTNAPASKRTSSSKATKKIKELNSSGAPRGRHVSMSPPPSSFPDSLQQVVKTQPHVLKEGMHVIQSYSEKILH